MFFLLTPLFLVVLFSFGNSAVTAFPMGGVSFKWYRELFANPYFWGAFTNSLIVAGSVGLVSTLSGTMGALALARMRPRVATPTMFAIAAPVMVPPLVVGLALMVFYVTLGLRLSVFTVILSHLVFTQPFVILIVHAAHGRLRPCRGGERARSRRLSLACLLYRDIADRSLDDHRCGVHRDGALARRLHHHLLHHCGRQHPADLHLGG